MRKPIDKYTALVVQPHVEVALDEIISVDVNYYLRANIGNPSGDNPQIGPIYFIYESNH